MRKSYTILAKQKGAPISKPFPKRVSGDKPVVIRPKTTQKNMPRLNIN